MQAIVLDVLLIFPDLLERSFNPKEGVGLDLLMSLDSTVFLFLLVSLIYGSTSCFLGQIPRLPIVAEAAESFTSFQKKTPCNIPSRNLFGCQKLFYGCNLQVYVRHCFSVTYDTSPVWYNGIAEQL
ncbi:Tic 20-v protein [Thalictrum thalictroides]|uniref:Protein TIC 20 n=1 Tax=Thalictrum thalictroides TaxID=46969 RepID=A0A7J6WHN9_THATH|nr:Tic 20-v protein [Thalictrum thalictroides]